MRKIGALAAAAAACAWGVPAQAEVFENVPALAEGLSAIGLRQHILQVGMAKPHAAPAPSPAGETPDVTPYPVRGIDVSHYEHVIRWDEVKNAGLSFVYIKASDGTDFQDEQFKANWEGAAKAGLRRGAYHFYNFCKPGLPQAENLISVLPKTPGMLPFAVDLEMSVECRKAHMPTRQAFLKEFAAFMNAVQKHYGMKPIFYLEDRIYAEYLTGVAENYLLWDVDLTHARPQPPNGRAWTIWQYSFTGRVPGIDTEVDLDVFYGTPEQLAQLAAPDGVMLASGE